MARIVTLSRDQWGIVFKATKDAPAARDAETQFWQVQLLHMLVDGLSAAEGREATLSVKGKYCAMIDAALANPTSPWRTEALEPVIWPIREAFGWKRPEAEDFDEEDS